MAIYSRSGWRMVRRLTRLRELTLSSLRISVVFRGPFKEIAEQYRDYATTASSHILSSSTFIYHPSIRAMWPRDWQGFNPLHFISNCHS
jgi:hypothetical protein